MSEMPDYAWMIQTEDGPSKYWNSGGFGTKYISAEKHESELQEKLRQQREACAERYYQLTDSDLWQQNTIRDAILNAEIDK